MSYTQQELRDAVIYALPNAEQRIDNTPWPKLLDDAAIELFINGNCEGSEEAIIREALIDLKERGKFQYAY